MPTRRLPDGLHPSQARPSHSVYDAGHTAARSNVDSLNSPLELRGAEFGQPSRQPSYTCLDKVTARLCPDPDAGSRSPGDSAHHPARGAAPHRTTPPKLPTGTEPAFSVLITHCPAPSIDPDRAGQPSTLRGERGASRAFADRLPGERLCDKACSRKVSDRASISSWVKAGV
jgi:hypothetical protein